MQFRFYIVFLLAVTLFSACLGTIRTGEQAWQYKRYAKGIVLLHDEFGKESDRKKKARMAFLLGDSYHNMGQYSNSIAWFKKAYDLGYGPAALEKYAFALKQNEDYEDAIRAFTILSEETGLNSVFRREINICKLALEWKKKSNKIQVDSVSPMTILNDPNSNEFSAHFTPDGNLLFSSDRIGSSGLDKYEWSGHFYFDLYSWDKTTGNIQNLGENINTQNNEGASCLGNGGNRLYFTRCALEGNLNSFCQIYYCELSDNSSSELIDLACISCNNMHPAVHSSDTLLVFSSDREGGKGGYDLYYSRKRNGFWSEPINMGANLNTQGNERFPGWNKDTLFFSSDYLPGMGGLDLFKTWIDRSGNWVAPQNLGSPVNSGGDDFGISFDPTMVQRDSIEIRAVFSSNRDQSSGDQLFQWIRYKFKGEEVLIDTRNKGKTLYFLNLGFQKQEGYFDLNEDRKLDSVYVKNLSSKSDYYTGAGSSLFLELAPDSLYSFIISRKGYWNTNWEVKIPQWDSESERDSNIVINAKVNLTPIVYGKPFVLEDVYFDFDKWEIKESSFDVLNDLVRFLKTNSKLKVSIQSHTDCRGEDAYNLNLSEKRAFSVFQYLIEKGVEPDRLTYKGMGEQTPAIPCSCQECTELEHLKNRRSTFTISR
jgi:outer membrane protein OmpA-like peptidoglycan-associated protein